MNRNLALFVLTLAMTAAASAEDAEFEALAERYVGDLANFSPVNATRSGDHRADGELDQVDAAARRKRARLYRDYLGALAGMNRDSLSRANQVDYEMLKTRLEWQLWSQETLQEWAWNPLYYVALSGDAIYGLVARDYAPIEDRLSAAASRLEQLPRFFRQAREALDSARVPKVHAETAIKQNPGLVSIIDNLIMPRLHELTPTTRSRLEAAIETAKDAVLDQQTWLEEELLPRAGGEFRVGAEIFDAKLAFALDSNLSRREIRSLAEAEYGRVRHEMYEIAKNVYVGMHPYTAFPDNPDEAYRQAIIRAALEQAYRELPPRDGIVDVAREYLQQAKDFVIENNILTMPEEPVQIIVMPEFRRGVAVAYLDAPGPLDREQPAFYAVAPLPEKWSDDQVESFLREYNLLSIQDLTIHEGMPGHYVQIALSNRYPSALRNLLRSGTFSEGWAVYAERMMIDAGYMKHEPLMELINLKWYLRAITNAIIDSAIHVDGMSRDAAMKLMIEGGFQEESEATGKWTRAQLSFTQLSTYFVGYQEHVAMRHAVEQDWGDEFTLRRYHDQALAYGSPPVKYVRALILGTDIPTSD